jgi:hypothetical protein
MKRTAISTIAAGALVLGAPSAALAHHHHHHHRPSSARHHAHTHHLRVQHAAPLSTTTSTHESGDGAGKVLSFTEGVLTIQPSHGPTLSAAVTAGTEIICEATDGTATASAAAGDSGSSGSQEGGNANSVGEAGGLPPWLSAEPSPPGGDESANDQQTEEVALEGQPCGESALVPGALVRQADLRIVASGATFDEITLIS